MITLQDIEKIVEEHKDEALQCLVEALQSPSPTGVELPMAVTMKKWIEKAGLPLETYEYVKDRPNYIATWKGSQEGKKFLFNGHMDVFPATEGEDEASAWSGEIKDGYVFGRGASDMKSGDCAALMSMMLLKKLGFDPKGSITLNLVIDEENGGSEGVLKLLENDLLEGDFGISMEPSGLDVVVGHGGTYPCQVIVYGDGGHTGMLFEEMNDEGNIYGGENAIQKAYKALTALYKLKAEIDARPVTPYGKSMFSITKINAGVVVNNHPRRAEIIIDRRYMPDESPESVDAEIIAALESVKKEDPAFVYEFHNRYEPDTPVCKIDEESDIVKALDTCAEEVLGHAPKHITIVGGADAAYIKAAIGTQMPWFGPGLIDAGLASTQESVSIENYLNCIKVYMLTLVKLMS